MRYSDASLTQANHEELTMLADTGTMRCTVADVDMVGYSDVARMLEENTSAGSVGELNRQIQGFITSALKQITFSGETRILAFTGDGGLLLFESAEDAHSFGCSLQQAAKQYSEQRNVPSAKRRFRIGLATGEVNLSSGGKQGDQYAGIAIANAVRLQTAAAPSEILIDTSTFAELTRSSQQLYSAAEQVRGKREETFRAHRCSIRVDDGMIPPHANEKASPVDPRATTWWKRHVVMLSTAAAVVVVLAIASFTLRGRQHPGDSAPAAAQTSADKAAAIPSQTAATPAHGPDSGKGSEPAGNPTPRNRAKAPSQSASQPDSAEGPTTPAANAAPSHTANQIPNRNLQQANSISHAPSTSDTKPPDPSEFDSPALVGTWEIASGDPGAAEMTLLELHSDQTYKKTLSANVKNPDGTSQTYGTTHNGHWRSRGTIVYLSGDGNSPEYLQDLSKARKLN